MELQGEGPPAWPRPGSALGPGLLLLAAFCAVLVFVPSDGWLALAVRRGLDVLLGRAAFLLPLLLAFVGVLLVVRRVRPTTVFPVPRLLGVGLLVLAVLAGEHLLAADPAGTGVLGRWLTGWLLDVLGQPLTVLVLVALVGVGTLMAFDVRINRVAKQPDAAR